MTTILLSLIAFSAMALNTRDIETIRLQAYQQVQAQQEMINEVKSITAQAKQSHKFKDYTQFAKDMMAKILKGYEKNYHNESPQAFVAVSLSMPINTLRSIMGQAKKMNMPVIIRGLVNNDYRQTVARVTDILTQGLSQPIQSGFPIDPSNFERYDIHVVPAYIVTGKPCPKEGVCPTENYDTILGTITPVKAMQAIIKRGAVGVSSAKLALNNFVANGGKIK